MKIYFAGRFTGPSADELRRMGVHNKLYSFANEDKLAVEWGSKGLMLDSGAFSVFTGKARVDIDKLIEFIKLLKPEVAIQLDVIGNDDLTWKNYQYMRKDLPDILPVIHYKAREEHIERVLAATNYVLLGGLVPLTRQKSKLFAWLDYLYGAHGLKDKKVHLLGITTKGVLERYPAFSCDSSSALSIHRYPSSDKRVFVKQKSRHYRELHQYGVRDTLALEKHITNLWKARGVEWS